MAARTNINIRIKLIVLLVFACVLGAAFWKDETFAKKNDNSAAKLPVEVKTLPPQAAPQTTTVESKADDTKIEGCATCHKNIEPMHRYNAKGDVFETVDETGHDAQGLTCTSCHGGNPAATTKNAAHVQPKFPKEWGCKSNGDCSSRNPERSNTLIAKESREFVRFVNPGDFRVVSQSCGQCHTDQNQRQDNCQHTPELRLIAPNEWHDRLFSQLDY